VGIKVVGTGKYPNPNRAEKKGEQEKPKRQRHPSKVKSTTPEKASKVHKVAGGLLAAANRARAKKAKTGTKKGKQKYSIKYY
jgi:hypothetical protein